MNPDEYAAKSRTEHGQQVALFMWAAQQTDERLKMLFAIPNGGQRGDGTKQGAKIAGANFKAEGVKSGVPDVMLPVPLRGYHGLFIEMKKIGGALDKNQKDVWIPNLTRQGYCVTTCYGFSQAREAIQWYLSTE